jgi:hypothetical protein
MKRLPIAAFALLFVLSASINAIAQSPERLEKVAEGEYWRWENGHPIKDTAQSWTIWRTKEGFEIESKLPPNKGALLLAAIGHDLFASESRELKEEARNAAVATEITIQLDRSMAVSALHVGGKSLQDGKLALVADCAPKDQELLCKGRLGSSRLKDGAQLQLLYSGAGPLLYLPLLGRAMSKEVQGDSFQLAVLQEVKNKPQLTEVQASLQRLGPDNLTIGDHVFGMQKFVLTFDPKSGLRQITLWASKRGIVFGVEDSRDTPGARILLSQYKKYTDF